MASLGGAETSGTIAGAVKNARKGDRIVVYARPETKWWVQPVSYAAFTNLNDDGTWRSTTHLGMEYAAVLVRGEYKVETTIPALPAVEGTVVAVAQVPAVKTILQKSVFKAKTIKFSDYDWTVSATPNSNGGKRHYYDPGNVWVDASGAMHLRMTRVANQWVCGEAHVARTLGYGAFQFALRDTGKLEPAATLGLFTWSEEKTEQNRREMNVHFSRWGDPQSKNAEFVIQPYYVPSNVYRFDVPPGPLTVGLHWAPGGAAFTTAKTDRGKDKQLAAWTFTAGVPESGDEKIYINFCEFGYAKVPLQREAEVIIDRFQFLP